MNKNKLFSRSFQDEKSIQKIQDDETKPISIKKSLKPKLINELNKKCEEKYKKKQMSKSEQFSFKNQHSYSKQKLTVTNGYVNFNQYYESQNHNVSIKKRKSHNKSKIKISLNQEEYIRESSLKKLSDQSQMLFANSIGFREKYMNETTNGKIIFKNGYVYEGQFQNNKFHGLGTLIFPNGKSIRAMWQKNQISNRPSKITYPSGQIYIGQIAMYRKHGFGYLFLIDGSQYVGQFFQGNIQGQGKYFRKNLLFGQGIWQNGELICQTSINLQKNGYFKLME